MQEERTRANIVVMGRVQGVFFRASTLERAQGLSLNGWVKNLADGSVEIEVEGPQYAVEQFVDWCRQGPSAARVSDVRVRWAKPTHEFRTFRIAR